MTELIKRLTTKYNGRSWRANSKKAVVRLRQCSRCDRLFKTIGTKEHPPTRSKICPNCDRSHKGSKKFNNFGKVLL